MVEIEKVGESATTSEQMESIRRTFEKIMSREVRTHYILVTSDGRSQAGVIGSPNPQMDDISLLEAFFLTFMQYFNETLNRIDNACPNATAKLIFRVRLEMMLNRISRKMEGGEVLGGVQEKGTG